MSIQVSDVTHAIAIAINWAKTEAKSIAKFITINVPDALQKVQNADQQVQAFTQELANLGVPYAQTALGWERAGEAVLALVIAELQKDGATAANGVTIQVGADIAQSVAALIPSIKSKLADVGIQVK
jgi:hypothetical protein